MTSSLVSADYDWLVTSPKLEFITRSCRARLQRRGWGRICESCCRLNSLAVSPTPSRLERRCIR